MEKKRHYVSMRRFIILSSFIIGFVSFFISYKKKEDTSLPDVNNSAYIIFMLIAIVGYFTIPTVSTWVIQASGAGNYGKQVNSWSLKGGRAAAAVSGAAVGHVAGKLRGR